MGGEPPDLDRLRVERARLDDQIRQMELTLEEEKKRDIMDRDYVKIACPECSGRGEISTGGADIISDPVEVQPCSYCEGGWVWARRWDGRQVEHSMTYDNRNPY